MSAMRNSSSLFTRFAKYASSAVGHPAAFILAVAIIVVWGITGPFLGFSDTWQLVINTGQPSLRF